MINNMRGAIMNYEQAIKFIRAVHNNGTKLGLQRNGRLTELLGNPQNSYKIVHVAGTNGKGSTCNLIHDVLMASGYKTGLFISPHLEEFTERIQINKVPIDKESLVRITALVKEKIELMYEEGYDELTEFEVITAIGFKYFQEQNIDILVLEVGMGGRHDATNVIAESLVSVITTISLDHTEFLGNTLEEIALEKAGIIKENSNVIIYPQAEKIKDVIKQEATLKNTKIFEADANNIRLIHFDLDGQTFEYMKKDVFNLPELKINLLGEHQLCNSATALLTLEVLKEIGLNINENTIKTGFETCRFPGRFEVLRKNPVILIDGGHNINGIEYFAKAVKNIFNNKKIVLFYGMLKDKHPDTVLDLLVPLCKAIYTITPDSYRAISAIELADLIKKNYTIEVVPLKSFDEASEVIKGLEDDDVAAFVGSLYLIGEARTKLKKS